MGKQRDHSLAEHPVHYLEPNAIERGLAYFGNDEDTERGIEQGSGTTVGAPNLGDAQC